MTLTTDEASHTSFALTRLKKGYSTEEVVRTMKLLGVSNVEELEPRHVTQLTRLVPVRGQVRAAADAVAR